MSSQTHDSSATSDKNLSRSQLLSRLLGLFLFACFASSVLESRAQLQIPRGLENNGSDTDAPDDSTNSRGSGKVNLSPGQVFRVMLEKIRSNEANVNRLYSTMPLGFPERQKEHMDQIDALVAETAQLRDALPGAAIEAFKAAPGQDQTATQYVFRTLNEMIEPTMPDSSFDPKGALEIVDTLIDAGADQDVVVLSKGFRSSFAIDDFDRASSMLDRISEANPDGNLDQIRQVVEDMKEKWERELMIRRLERNNDNLPTVKFETTAGDFVVVLYEDHAPNTVANFISLVEKKFYNDLTFHYVKPGEYIHTGCPNGDGTGGPGYSIASEYDREQIRHYFAGTLGMANTGPETEGSQFVITHQAIPQLNGLFTAFGRVIEGFDVVLGAKAMDPQLQSSTGEGPEPIRIIKAEVLSKRDHEYEPERITKSEVDAILGLDSSTDNSDDIFAPRTASEDVPALDGGGLFSPSNP